MARSLVRIGLALILATTSAGWGHAERTKVTEFKATFGDSLMLRNDNLGRPYISEKIVGWTNWAYASTVGSELQVLYPGGSRYVVVDFGDISPAGADYLGAGTKPWCDPIGSTATPVQIDAPSFLVEGAAHVLQPPNPTRVFKLITEKEYRWEPVNAAQPESGYHWQVYGALDIPGMADSDTRYVKMWVSFTTPEMEAIGATAYLAFDSQTGVNPIGQVPSLGKVHRSGNTWTITAVPVDEHGSGGLAKLSYQLQPNTKLKRSGYHSCSLGWYEVPFELTLSKR